MLGSICEKNILGKTVAETAPYAVKSIHSSAEPTVLATVARFAIEFVGAAGMSIVSVSLIGMSPVGRLILL
jgi:hypothetical protein